MSKKDSLVEAIDRTALGLLQKISGDNTMTTQDSAILVEQVKAFGEIVKWAQARPSLIPKDNQADAKFAKLKDDFHGVNRTPRGRRAADPPPAESSPASPALALLAAGAGDDDGDEDE
jgi:hypothetical protein